MENEKEKNNRVIYSAGEVGQVIMNDEIISIIAGLAVRDVEGVYKLVDSTPVDRSGKVSARNFGRAVSVSVTDGHVDVDLVMSTVFGHDVPVVAKKVQDKVSGSIENMLGLPVTSVNIQVVDLQM